MGNFMLRTAVLASAAALYAPGARAASPPTEVVLVGDSITAGYGASSFMTAYSNDLQNLFGSATHVAAFGHPGATMLSNSMSPFVPYIQQTEYTGATTEVMNAAAGSSLVLVIMLGTNDSASPNWFPAGGGDSHAAFISDYEAMIDHFAGLGPHPSIFVALPPAIYNTTNPTGPNDCNLRYDVIPAIKQVAMDKNVPTIDVYTPTSGHPEWFMTDGIHPSDPGHQTIADAMYAAILGVPYTGPEAGPGPGGVCDGGAPVTPDGGGLTPDAGTGSGSSSAGTSGGTATSTRSGTNASGSSGNGASSTHATAASDDHGSRTEASSNSSGCGCVVGAGAGGSSGGGAAGAPLILGVLALWSRVGQRKKRRSASS